MFKCSECGAEFKIKPDFCDCGNDAFEEISEVKKNTAEQKHKKTFNQQYPGISAFWGTLDPLSVLFFIFCIILSVLALIFINPSEQNVTDNANQKDIPTKNLKVADINSFWDDTPPVRVQAQNTVEPPQTIADRFMDILPKQEPQTQPQKVQTKVQQPAKVEQKKTTSPSAQKPAQQKPPVSKPAKNNQKTQTVSPKPVQQQQTKSQTQTVQKPANQTQKTSPQPVYQQPSQQQPLQQQAPQQQVNTQPKQTIQQSQPVINSASVQAQAAQEFKNYKNGLRNTIFSKINFANVYSDGSCVVDFQINSSGKLINRKFSKQSTNNTLNDEVYSAIINTPTYKAPPGSYNGQTLHFSVKFTNGQYEVSLY